MRALLPLVLLLVAAAPAGREPIGQYGCWGVFRDRTPVRCWTVALPLRPRGAARVMVMPGPRVTFATGAAGDVRIAIDGRRIKGQPDRTIVAAMRRGETLRIAGRDRSGGRFRDTYPLAGFASAIDAATLACLR